MTSARIIKASDTANEYTRLEDIKADSTRVGLKIYGWANGRFYEVFPGGRTIEYTDLREE
jgi:hypothetical protein